MNHTDEPRMVTFGETDLLANFDERMAQPRMRLEDGDLAIESRAELLAAIKNDADLSLVSGFRWFPDYNECFELPLLCHAPAATENPWGTEGLAEQVYRHFDLGTIGSSFGPRRPADSYRYSDFDLPTPEFSANGFMIETDRWYYGLQLIAIADFNGDGVADVLAWFVDHAKRASYFDVSPIILSRDAIGSDIRGQRVFESVLDGTLATWPDDPMSCERAN